ncbi:MAG: HlyD family type I secretion periplasmic adaptor subunit [Proteobacteria bacterium]|nr:HlyD family type I secretion periplasmic adaptor subunit [Pseudomonadota bacterium]
MNFFKKIRERFLMRWEALRKWRSELLDRLSETTEYKNSHKKPFRLFPEIQKEETDFISDSKAALMTKTTPLAGMILYSILALIVVGLVWAYFAPIDQVTVGEGKVIPSSEVKVIQSLDGGIIASIDVEEGTTVKNNQKLLRFDDTRYKSDYAQAREKYFALEATITRLSAETQGLDEVIFPLDLQQTHADLIATETKLFQARKEALTKELSVLTQNHELATKEMKIYEPLVKSGVVPKIDYYKAQRVANEIQDKMLELQDKYRQEALTELNQRKADQAVITESLTSLQDKMQRTTINSPVNGIVKKIYIHTIGAVVQTGQIIMEIVPIEDSLLIQAKVKPSEIAFIQLGQDATVKITAYDYSIYGSLPGKVEYISADTIEDTKANPAADKDIANYYLVNVRTQKSYLGNEKHKLPIMPGMNATVHIMTGKKTVMQYILKPLIKAKQESLRER